MNEIGVDRLREIAVWAGELDADEVARAARGMSERTLAKGAYLFHAGDRFDAWSGVVTGLVKMSSVNRAGKTTTYTGVGSGGWFGEGSIIKDEKRRYDIMALRDTRIALMNNATFHWLFQNSAAFNRYLVKQINERLGLFIATVGNDRMLDSVGRVARSIAWIFNPVLSPHMSNSVEITQVEIGNLAGVSRQVANRSLRMLEEEGLLRVIGERIEIVNIDGLMTYGE